MLVALIHPVENYTATVEGTEIPDLRAQLIAAAPAGWDMVSAHGTAAQEQIHSLSQSS